MQRLGQGLLSGVSTIAVGVFFEKLNKSNRETAIRLSNSKLVKKGLF